MPSSRKKIRVKYLKDLSPKERVKHKKAILKSRKAAKKGKYATRPKLKSFKNKKSPHVKKALKKFNLISMKDLQKISKETGCSTSSLKIIIKKGRGAYYSDGSRANQNADSWAYARLASAITGGGASKTDYEHLVSGKCNSKVMRVAKKPKKKSRAPKIKKFQISQKKEKKPVEKPWITYEDAHKYENEAKEENVSKVARSGRGFMRAYEKYRTKTKLEKVKVPKFPTQNWRQRRNAFVARHLKQYNKKPTPRRWLALVMWAYKPTGKRPKKSTKNKIHIRKKSRGISNSFRVDKKGRSPKMHKRKIKYVKHLPPKPKPYEKSRGGTAHVKQLGKLIPYNPNWSDISAQSILNSRLPPMQKYFLLGIWAAANYSPATKMPDIIRGDGGYLYESDKMKPGMLTPSIIANYSPGKLVEGIQKSNLPRRTRKSPKRKEIIRKKKALKKK